MVNKINVLNSLQLLLGEPDYGFFGSFFVDRTPIGMFALEPPPPLLSLC